MGSSWALSALLCILNYLSFRNRVSCLQSKINPHGWMYKDLYKGFNKFCLGFLVAVAVVVVVVDDDDHDHDDDDHNILDSVFCSLCWPQTLYIGKTSLELLVFLLLPPKQ